MSKSTASEKRASGSWLSHRLTRAALLVSVPLAVVGGVRAVGWTAAALKQWNDGDTLKAADLNANFAALSAQIAALGGAPLTWTSLALGGGWAAYGDDYATPSWAKDASGVVHLRGLVKGLNTPQVTMAVLPAGAMPKHHLEEPVACAGSVPCTIVVKNTGEVILEMSDGKGTWLSFDGVAFDVAGSP